MHRVLLILIQIVILKVGCGWQALVAYINVGCYYVIGIPLGCLLGFKFDFGVKGIWSGMLGGTCLQTIILLIITYKTNWNKEVEKAAEIEVRGKYTSTNVLPEDKTSMNFSDGIL